MTYRKTWFSCVPWILYSIICVLLLAQAGSVWVSYLSGIPYAQGFPDSVIAPLANLPRSIRVNLGLLVIPAAAVLYWIVRGLAEKIRKKYECKERTVRVLECIVVFLSMTGGIFLRIERAGFYLSMMENEAFIASHVRGKEYYGLALVTKGSSVPYMEYGAAYLYVLCLSVLLSFLGNKLAVAVFLQVFLQIAGMGLAYAGTRKLAGRLPACLALIYLACSPACLNMLVCFSPEWMFFDLYMIGLVITAGFVKKYCTNRFSRPMAVLEGMVTGVIIGLLTYLDITSVTLLVLTVAVATGQKSGQGESFICSAKMNAVVILTTVFSAVLGWFGVVSVISFIRGIGLSGGFVEWAVLHICNTQTFGFRPMYPYTWDIYLVGVLVVPAAFLIFEFFRGSKIQNYTLWLIFCILTAPTPMAVIGVNAFGIFSLYIWGVMAGLGLQNCIFGCGEEVMQAVMEESDIVTEKSEEMQQMQETQEIPEIDERPRFIENPLPLPKKHVKREMDYQYPVSEEDMKYDVEISDDDDFDIE